jgi:hypothetical protein
MNPRWPQNVIGARKDLIAESLIEVLGIQRCIGVERAEIVISRNSFNRANESRTNSLSSCPWTHVTGAQFRSAGHNSTDSNDLSVPLRYKPKLVVRIEEKPGDSLFGDFRRCPGFNDCAGIVGRSKPAHGSVDDRDEGTSLRRQHWSDLDFH